MFFDVRCYNEGSAYNINPTSNELGFNLHRTRYVQCKPQISLGQLQPNIVIILIIYS